MRRVIVTFMLMLLPFQLVWGAAASYCQHEQGGAGSRHFGHHVHKHQGKVLKTSGDVSPEGKSLVCDDPACASCHLTCVAPVMTAVVAFAPDSGDLLRAAPTYRYPSHILSSIERPNWTLAA